MGSSTPRLSHIPAVTRPEPSRAAALAVNGGMAAIALCCAMYALLRTLHYGVNTPFWDDWDWVLLARQLDASQISFRDVLLISAGEHKIATQVLLSFAGWHLTGMNLTALMVWNWFVAVLACVVSFFVAARELGIRSFVPWLTLAASAFFVFNPAAYQYWTWAVPHIYVLLPLFFLIGVRLVQSRTAVWLQVLLLAALAVVSSFTIGNGLLFWIMFPAVLSMYHHGWSRAAGKPALAVAALCFAVTIGVYVHGLAHYSNPSPPGTSRTVAGVLLFFLTFTGNFVSHALSPQPVRLAQMAGLLLIALYVAAARMLLRHHDDAAQRRLVLIWTGLGGFTLLSGGLVSVARLGFGVAYAMDASRYSLAACFLPIAATVLAAIAILSFARRLPVRLVAYSAMISGVSILFFIAVAARYMQAPAADRLLLHCRMWELQGKVALAGINLIDLPTYRNIFPRDNRDEFKESAAFLQRKGWLRPALWDDRFRQRLASAAPASGRYGVLEKFESGPQQLRLEGWAYLADRDESAHAIIVSAFEEQQPARILAVVFTSLPRPDIMARLKTSEATGWTAEVPAPALAGHRYTIRCFGYDAETGAVYPLSGQGQTGEPAVSVSPR